MTIEERRTLVNGILKAIPKEEADSIFKQGQAVQNAIYKGCKRIMNKKK